MEHGGNWNQQNTQEVQIANVVSHLPNLHAVLLPHVFGARVAVVVAN